MVLFKFAVASVDVIIVVFMGVVEVVLEVFCIIEVVCKSSHVAELQKEPFPCKNFCDTLYVLGIVDLRPKDWPQKADFISKPKNSNSDHFYKILSGF